MQGGGGNALQTDKNGGVGFFAFPAGRRGRMYAARGRVRLPHGLIFIASFWGIP